MDNGGMIRPDTLSKARHVSDRYHPPPTTLPAEFPTSLRPSGQPLQEQLLQRLSNQAK